MASGGAFVSPRLVTEKKRSVDHAEFLIQYPIDVKNAISRWGYKYWKLKILRKICSEHVRDSVFISGTSVFEWSG